MLQQISSLPPFTRTTKKIPFRQNSRTAHVSQTQNYPTLSSHNLYKNNPIPVLNPQTPLFSITMAKKEMKVVKGLDIEKYMGRWYEIASFPSFFEPKDSTNTRATYTLKEDGATVDVLNETWSKGKKVSIEGTAYKADPKSDEAKLKVKFYVPPFLPIIPVVGDYWVLFIDEDYQYVLVGGPTKKFLWILCRQTQLDEDVYNQLLEKATEQGYDVKKLKKTPQIETPAEGDEAPKDKGTWWIKSIFGK